MRGLFSAETLSTPVLWPSRVVCDHAVLLHEKVPYRVLNFLTSYINYGGRVTDYIDLRTIDVIMRTFYTPRVGKYK